MTVAVTARTAGKVTLNVVGDRLITHRHAGRAGRHRADCASPVGSDWGSGAYVVATLRRPLDAQAQRMPGRAIGVQWFAHQPQGPHARGRSRPAAGDAAERRACAFRSSSPG